MVEEERTPEKKDQDQRMALGVTLGVSLGVALSLVLDNWAFIGVGIAVGVSFGAIPASGWKDDEKDDREA